MTAIVAVEKNKSLKKKSYSFKSIGGRYHSFTSTNHLLSSKDKSVATVDKNGRVTAKKAGKTVISAKIYSKTLKCRITVSEQNE
ncbi:MAG: Ig-like domain-containing protein [Lachnospiraceae bacterium]|nr:Ig-like domain-containing protein [Lachnospiraceae bacterium]